MSTLKTTLRELRSLGTEKNRKAQSQFNITAAESYGVSAPDIRRLAGTCGTDHPLALLLWETKIHEARILAALVADPLQCTKKLADRWTATMENWAQCDACCAELFQRTPFASELPFRWTSSDKEYRRRAGLVMVAVMAVHHKRTDDREFLPYMDEILRAATDERPMVRKAVSWAVRQMGKRSPFLHKKAIALAKKIQNIHDESAAWSARDILNELTDPMVGARIQRRKVNR